MNKRIEGKIAAILDRTTVVINRGMAHGVILGDIFFIYTKIGPFIDPDTGEDLGETTRVWGRVEVTILEDKFCIAKTQLKNPFTLSLAMSVFGTSRIQLPVDETDITKYAEKIGLGFPVISERSDEGFDILSEEVADRRTLPHNDIPRIVEDAVERFAIDLSDKDDQVISAMANTNASGYGLDFYEIASYEYNKHNEEIYFKAKIELSGDRDEDKPFCGDTISVEVSGTISNAYNKWSVVDYSILSCDVNW